MKSRTLHHLRQPLLPCAACVALLLCWGCSVSTGPSASSNAGAASPAGENSAPAGAAKTAAPETAGAPASQGARQDFTLVNATGVEINKLFISPHDKDDWGEDILGRDTLPSGQGGDIRFNRDEKAAMWDLRVEDAEGNPIEWENLNLLQISKVTLHYENGRAWADTE
jgi:hypothetical protein